MEEMIFFFYKNWLGILIEFYPKQKVKLCLFNKLDSYNWATVVMASSLAVTAKLNVLAV